MPDNPSVKVVSRMALVALVIGTSVTVSATERVTLPLILAGTIGWSFVPFCQLLTGLLLTRGVGGGRTMILDRYFATHWPWSLWILAVHAVFLMAPVVRSVGLGLALTAPVPIIWTVRLLLGFCRSELGMDRRQSVRRVGLHQAATYLLVLGYIFFAVALWPRIVGLVA
jgi:hypothetical protein